MSCEAYLRLFPLAVKEKWYNLAGKLITYSIINITEKRFRITESNLAVSDNQAAEGLVPRQELRQPGSESRISHIDIMQIMT